MKTSVARDMGAVKHRGFWWVPDPIQPKYRRYQYGGRCCICGDHFIFQPHNRVLSHTYGLSCDKSCGSVAAHLTRSAA